MERTLDLFGLLSIGIVTMFLVSAQAGLSNTVVNIFKAVAMLIAAILAVIVAGTKKESLVIKLVVGITSRIPIIKRYSIRLADFTSSLIEGSKG